MHKTIQALKIKIALMAMQYEYIGADVHYK